MDVSNMANDVTLMWQRLLMCHIWWHQY